MFRVKRIDDRPVRTSLAGQYVTLQMLMPDGTSQPRQYSLTGADDGKGRQFSVKRVSGGGKPDGEVSNLLYDVVNGETSSPCRCHSATSYSTTPAVRWFFCSAGIGIAPMAGMLSNVVAAGSHFDVRVLHADLNEESFALRQQVLDDVRALPHASLHVWYEQGAEGSLPVDGRNAGWMDFRRSP
jgi:nitric oxide dioxygenase